MIESIIVYTSLIILMPTLALFSIPNKVKCGGISPTRLYFGFTALLIITYSFVFGARYNVGIDYISYLNRYGELGRNLIFRDTLEPGYVFMTKSLSQAGFHFFFFFALFAGTQLFFLISTFKKKEYLLPALMFVLLSGYFMDYMSIMRQMTVTSIFIWTVSRIDKISFLKYSIIIILCVIFLHKSSIILLPLYPLIKTRKSLTFNYFIQISIFIGCFFAGYSHFILDKFEDFSTVVAVLGYDQYADKNLLEEFYKDQNWGIRTFLRAFTILYTIILSKQTKQYYKDCFLERCYNIFFWGVCAQMIVLGIDVVSRIFVPFYSFKIVIYAYTLNYLYVEKMNNYSALFKFITYISLILSEFLFLFYEASQPDNSVAFSFFWQHQISYQ